MSRYDEHWKPMFLLCPPCHFKFDVIVKMETFDRWKEDNSGTAEIKASCSRDTQFILSQRSLEDEVSLRKKHSSSSSTKSQDKKVSRHQLLRFLGSKTCPDFTWQPALLYLMCVFLGRCKNSVLSALKTYGASAVRQVPA